MSDFLLAMGKPFLACMLLSGILVYLGIHVLSRKVIFVDLALAQIAGLGSVCGVLLGWDLHDDPWAVKGFSLAFTFLGAAVFTLTRTRDERVPHEALIGISYAVSLGATILASSRLAHGAEEVSELLAGSILWVRWPIILSTALVFGVIGAFHWIFRRQFFRLSLDPDGAEREGLSVRMWDFLFYVSLGCAVTSSVSIAGVLLVFSYLVIPSVVGVLFAESIGARLVVGWTVGTLVSAAGVSISYFQDLPSGPTIVVTFGAFLLLAGLAHYIRHAPGLAHASLRIALGGATLGVLLGAAAFLRKHENLELAHLLEKGNKAERIQVLARVAQDPSRWHEIEALCPELLARGEIEIRLNLLDLVQALGKQELLPAVHALLSDPDDAVREGALKCVRALARPESVEPLLAAAKSEEDEYLRVELAETVIELGDERGIPILLGVMESGTVRQARKDAWEHLNAHVHPPLEFHPDFASSDHDAEIRALRQWWEANRGSTKLR
jgi:zinc/manganese transport system permease protein